MTFLKIFLRIALAFFTILYLAFAFFNFSDVEPFPYSRDVAITIFAFGLIPIVGILTFISTYRRLKKQSVFSFFKVEFWLLLFATIAVAIYYVSLVVMS